MRPVARTEANAYPSEALLRELTHELEASKQDPTAPRILVNSIN